MVSNGAILGGIGIFGASGFAREVADVCFAMGYRDILFIDHVKPGPRISAYPVYDETAVEELQKNGFSFVIGVGDNKLRKTIFEKFFHLSYVNLVHPSSTWGIGQREALEGTRGNIVTAGVRFTNNIRMGNFGNFHINCTISHDCILEDFVNIAPGANVSGNVFLSEGAYIGTNATVNQGRSIDEKMRIGRFSTVGAGAVVTRHVSDYSTVAGIPARPISRSE
jgi:sugar O-acyltransferase (sialic acid O-acetyltransferase NeuD family)